MEMEVATPQKRITKPRIEFDLAEVEKLAGLGLTRKQIADSLGISETTLYSRRQESGEFDAAIKRGAAKGIQTVANSLFQNAVVNNNSTSQIFFLKARAGWRDTDRLEITGKDGAPIELKSAESEKRIQELMSILNLQDAIDVDYEEIEEQSDDE